MSETDTNSASEAQTKIEPEFEILRVFLKDASFESPLTPTLFVEKNDWDPSTNLQLNAESRPVADNIYEVVLHINVSQTQDDTTLVMVEIKQAGLFRIQGFDKDRLGHMLGAYCPTVLFPFAREVVAELINKGGLPPLLLAPINFDALYARHLQKVQQSAPAPEMSQ